MKDYEKRYTEIREQIQNTLHRGTGLMVTDSEMVVFLADANEAKKKRIRELEETIFELEDRTLYYLTRLKRLETKEQERVQHEKNI